LNEITRPAKERRKRLSFRDSSKSERILEKRHKALSAKNPDDGGKDAFQTLHFARAFKLCLSKLLNLLF
jgi:hypothetical protein